LLWHICLPLIVRQDRFTTKGVSLDPVERENIRLRLEGLVKDKVLTKRIQAITVNPLYHGSSKMRVEVGRMCANLEPDTPPQMVLTIFESKSFLVCTPDRGADHGLPFIFTRTEVVKVEEAPE